MTWLGDQQNERAEWDKRSAPPLLAAADGLEPLAPLAAAVSATGLLLRGVFVAVIGSVLAWLILTHSLAAYLADATPQAALALRPAQSAALVRMAEKCLEWSKGASAPGIEPEGRRTAAAAAEACDTKAGTHTATAPPATGPPPAKQAYDENSRAAAADLAERAIRSDPLNAKAFRLLGDTSDLVHDDKQTRELMSAAARLSMHESGAQLWLLQSALLQGRYEEAAANVDALLRIRPQFAQYLVPALAVMAERPAARGLVTQLLAVNPPWRALFFQLLPKSISNIRTPDELLQGLKASPSPPQTSEISPYLDFLVERQLYDEASSTWLQLLSPEQLALTGNLYNRNFEVAPSGMTFDWRVPLGRNYSINVVPGSSEGRSQGLNIEFLGSRTNFSPVTQLVLLQPGDYTFKGRWKGNVTGLRGLVWKMACVGQNSALGASPMLLGATSTWIPFEFAVSVPASGCKAQLVSLVLDARSASESIVQGSVWIRDLDIVSKAL